MVQINISRGCKCCTLFNNDLRTWDELQICGGGNIASITHNDSDLARNRKFLTLGSHTVASNSNLNFVDSNITICTDNHSVAVIAVVGCKTATGDLEHGISAIAN